MITTIQVQVSPEVAYSENLLREFVSRYISIKFKEISHVQVAKRSIDARGKSVKINLELNVYINEHYISPIYDFPSKKITSAKEVHIIGAGPGGLFAALQCIEEGLKPIIFERGKNVSERRRDLANLTKNHIVNSESNYCFGEGGAGTYSDGKLYTRSNKRGDVQKVLGWLIAHGAGEEILAEAHPHIGTNKLPAIIEAIRKTILDCGGEIHFNKKLTNISYNSSGIKKIELNYNENIDCTYLILATGHSARDIFELLQQKEIQIEYKPFAIGVRAEHSQELIDKIQYKCSPRYSELPAASYSLVEQIENLGVYSFCMCPGGIIAPCATAPGEIVTNGWSPSKRNNPFANSGIVVAVDEKALIPFEKHGALKGLRYQQMIEQKAWEMGGKTQTAPAQRMVDFCEKKFSSSLPDCSYYPGTNSVSLYDVLPPEIALRLQKAFPKFGMKMRGYFTNDAILVGVESRTSSPVRIPRNAETLEHVQLKGLFPCGEGAGYAGGIMSAAMDGMRVVEKIVVNN